MRGLTGYYSSIYFRVWHVVVVVFFRNNIMATALCLGGIGAVFLAAVISTFRNRSPPPPPPLPETKSVRLLYYETTYCMGLPAISSLTIFKGAAPTEDLRVRLSDITKANPWLSGRLVRRPGKKVTLEYNPGSSSISPCPAVPLDEIPVGTVDLCAPYDAMMASICETRAVVPLGRKLVNVEGDGGRLFRVTLIHGVVKGDPCFALFVSMSHVIADGHSYYSVLNMLSRSALVVSLSPERKCMFDTLVPKLLGEDAIAFYRNSLASAVKRLYHTYLTRQAPARVFLIDPKKCEKTKRGGSGEVAFVSTNDITTSSFLNLSNTDVGSMVINLRGRVPELLDSDAGNYMAGILFLPDDFRFPSLVRKALQNGFRRASRTPPRPLPMGWARFRAKMAIATNWASFFNGLELRGCTQLAHLPLNPPQPPLHSLAVFFRPRPGELAVLVYSDTFDLAKDPDSPFGEELTTFF